MWKYILILFISLSVISCKNNDNKLPADMVNNPNSAEGIETSAKLPQISFVKTTHEFGTVIQGEVVTYNFKFTNTGDADLLITKVSTSCGCTASNYPTKPIKPGDTDAVEVKFNSEGRMGFQNKRVSVLTNATPAQSTLFIRADVVKPGQ